MSIAFHMLAHGAGPEACALQLSLLPHVRGALLREGVCGVFSKPGLHPEHQKAASVLAALEGNVLILYSTQKRKSEPNKGTNSSPSPL